MTTDVLAQCRGRWKSIHAALGIPVEFLNPRRNGPCPMCHGVDRWRWTDKNGEGTWVCNSCGRGAGGRLVMLWLKCSWRDALDAIKSVVADAPIETRSDRSDRQKIDAMARLWGNAHAVTPESVAGRYLASRGLLGPYPKAIRHVVGGPMLAQIIGADGKAVSLQRTIFGPDGRKIGRKMAAGACPLGSAVRLAPVTDEMGIAEGVETAMSASLLYRVPVWAAISADGLARFVPPPGVRKLWIFADNDRSLTGQAVGYALGRAMIAKGLDAAVMIPQTIGWDWSDVLCEGTR